MVEILEWWAEAGCWWDGRPARIYYRVLAEGNAVYELCHESEAASSGREEPSSSRETAGRWFLHRIID